MRIKDIRTRLFCSPLKQPAIDAAKEVSTRDVILINILTDEEITGMAFLTGSGVAHGSESYVIKVIIDRALKPIAVGADPIRTQQLWHHMFRETARFGRKGAVLRAISGVDLALWDILSKKAGLPLYKLLGGHRTQVKAYASGGCYSQSNGLNELVKEMVGYVERGFKAVKMKIGGAIIADDARRVAAVREAIGDEVDLMVDANEKYDVDTAVRVAKMIEKYNIFWFEEPLPADDLEGYARLTKKIDIPLAAGENEYTRYGFRDLIVNGGIDIIQPDVTRVGGISEWMRIATIASLWDIPCAPHAVQELHVPLVSAVPNGMMVEFFDRNHPLQEFISNLFREPANTKQPKGGCINVSERLGLGLALDGQVFEEAVNKYEVNSQVG